MTDETRVLYNAECPVCSFEIDHYKKHSQKNALPLRFDDLNTEARTTWNLTQDQAAQRLYVQHQGQLYSGIPAFLILWKQMPGYHWLARIVGWPGVRQFATLAYDWVLAPLIYRWHLRRKARAVRLGNQ